MNTATPNSVRSGSGFTLVELVIVIVVIGIIAGALGLFVASPVLGFLAQERRLSLTDSADLALLRLSRDLSRALPNSVRTSGPAIELLLTLDGERYRAEAPGLADDRLDAGIPDSAFNTLAPINGGAAIPPGARLAIYPLGLAGADPYVAADGVMTPAGTTISRSLTTVSGASESRLSLDAPHTFPLHSPSRRVFLVEGPVSYLHSGRNLLRYEGYAVQAGQPDTLGALNSLANPVVIADNVAAFSVSYSASGSARRNAVARLLIELEDGGESVHLLRQVQVNNTP